MSLPRISIVTPSFNQAPFLERTIKSVLMQKYPNLEYMVLDAASTDTSPEIIARYANQLTFSRSAPDRGQSGAICEGWQRSTGDVLAWLNSDDYYDAGALAMAGNYFAAHPDVMVVWGTVAFMDEDGQLLRHKNPRALGPADFLLTKDVPGQAASFIRRSVFERLGGPRLDLHYVMDWELWLRIVMHYPPAAIACIDEVLATATEWRAAKTFTAERRDLAEVRKILEETFNSPDLQPELCRLRTAAFARTWWRQSKSELEAGLRGCALRSLVRAWTMSPGSFGVGKTLRQFKRIAFQRQTGTVAFKRDKRIGNL